jgi:hypothetical protein
MPGQAITDPHGISQETIMLRKSTLLAVVASAALGLAMLAPTSASAMGGHGGHGGGIHGGGGHGMHGGGHGGHGGWNHHRHHPRWHVRYHRPIWYGVRPVYTAYSTRIVSPGPCTCLSKEYTPEGAVLFRDRCTNEAAMNPPAPAPQQTGALEPQGQQYSQQYVQPQPQAR